MLSFFQRFGSQVIGSLSGFDRLRFRGTKGSAAVTRKLRLLRAHGLITKVPSTHRYVLSEKGRSACAAILAARQADTTTLLQAASEICAADAKDRR